MNLTKVNFDRRLICQILLVVGPGTVGAGAAFSDTTGRITVAAITPEKLRDRERCSVVHVNGRSAVQLVQVAGGRWDRTVTRDDLKTECEHVSTSIFLGIHEQCLLHGPLSVES